MPTFTPGAAAPRTDPLALGEPKTLSPLFGSAWKLWIGQPSVFLVSAAWVVIPFYVVVVGLIGSGFHDSVGQADAIPDAVNTLFMSTLGSALITAIHARAVVSLARGQQLTTGDAVRLGFQRVLPVLGVALLYGFAVVFGLIFLIIPGVYVSVAYIFAAQHTALTDDDWSDSFDESMKLVKANGWWRTFGYLLVLGLVTAALTAAAAIPVYGLSFALGEPGDLGLFAVPFLALMQAVAMSFTALVSTLLYFSWKAGMGEHFVADPTQIVPSAQPLGPPSA